MNYQITFIEVIESVLFIDVTLSSLRAELTRLAEVGRPDADLLVVSSSCSSYV